jgi:farnesyl diphosphate synthase
MQWTDLKNCWLEDWSQYVHKRNLQPLGAAATYTINLPSKHIRPLIIYALGHDLGIFGSQRKNLFALSSAVELHHTYSLIHDDLPCMDNDPMRRGAPSMHCQYGEAFALLTGDLLISESYLQLLALDDTCPLKKIIKLFGWATGKNGLIAGQWDDLSMGKETSAKKLFRMSELKTARLFQWCTLSTLMISKAPIPAKDFMRLGSYIGLLFQWLDDNADREADKICPEKNAWLSYPELTQKYVSDYQEYLKKLHYPMLHQCLRANGF